MFKRFLLSLIVLMLAFSFVPVSVAAGADDGNNERTFGIVPVKGRGNVTPPSSGSGKLTYHGGPVMHTNAVYAIYWVPSGYTTSAGYSSLINRYFRDVAADSGTTGNVYFSDTQYYSVSGGTKSYITYNSKFKGYYQDTRAYPANGCPLYSDPFNPSAVITKCLTDAQIQAEIKRVVNLNHWTANSTTEFFMFTANGVGSCFNSSGSQCAFVNYCAYHSWIGPVLYSNMPYTHTDAPACDVPYSPNSNFAADSTISVLSHEHNETITDPHLNAWYDNAGYENGDKCAWIFGSVSASHKFNQTINGHHYILQEEWSNKTNKCLLKGK